jgi:hypothetical protein
VKKVATRPARSGAVGSSRVGIRVIARATDLSRQTLYRIEQDPAAAEAATATWGQ